jgi:hypothetical protein
MSDTVLKGYADVFGKHAAAIADHTGPASYTTGGETIQLPSPLGLRSIDFLFAESISVSGNYRVTPQSLVGGGALLNKAKLQWFPNPQTVPGVPIGLGTLSAAATQSAMTANGVVTVTGANTLKAGNFVLMTNGATAVGIFLNGAIVQITSATATSYTFNFAAAKALNYVAAADTLKYQLLQVSSTNLVQLGQSVAVTAVAVASNVLTVTCGNAAGKVAVGNFVVLQGLAAGEVPQGAIVQVLTASTTQFTANIIAPNLSVTSNETATATVLVTNGGAPVTANDNAFTISGTTVAATAASSSAAGAITVLPVTQAFVPGNIIVIQGLTHGAALNGLITPVLAASLSATNVTTNGYIASAVTTGTSDLGIAALLTTGLPAGSGEVPSGTNLSGETVRIMAIGG